MNDDPKATSENKTQAYGSLYSINHAFQEIGEHLQRLEERQVLTPEFAEERRTAIEELRAGINHGIAAHMLSTEQEDWARFGRLRIAQDQKQRLHCGGTKTRRKPSG